MKTSTSFASTTEPVSSATSSQSTSRNIVVPHVQFAFTTPATISKWGSKQCKLAQTSRRSRVSVSTMTLSPQDCPWKSGRNLQAIESEFYVTARTPGSVDKDMHRLRQRILLISRKEKQWAEFCQQFASLSILTGIPMVDSGSGHPTATAWIFLSLSAALPLYILSSAAQLLQASSIAFN